MEFHTVFITKFADVMLANESYDAQDIVSQNMNLLYVAVTRAQRMLYIVHEQSDRKHICSLMLDVPPATY
jgi:ATP-dependent exoDNAse (exonuclease V) beta subunit